MATFGTHSYSASMSARYAAGADRIVIEGYEGTLLKLGVYLSADEAERLAEEIKDARTARDMALKEVAS